MLFRSPRVQETEDQLEPARTGTVLNWNKANKICLNTMLNALSNELYDLYCVEEFVSDVWQALEEKYKIEDEGNKKHVIEKFLEFKMTEDNSVSSQIYEFQNLVTQLEADGMPQTEKFVVEIILEKLPPSWKEYQNNMRRKIKNLLLKELIIYIRSEENNRLKEKT